jgi:hypothetical protein
LQRWIHTQAASGASARVGNRSGEVIRRRPGQPDVRVKTASRQAADALAAAGKRAPYRPSFPGVTNADGSVTYTHPTEGWKVTYDPQGFPDFSTHLRPGRNTVRIQLTGSRTLDEAAANAKAGFTKGTPDGYTWHHNQELGLMQLVDEEVHAAFSHTGGVAVWEAVTGRVYR